MFYTEANSPRIRKTQVSMNAPIVFVSGSKGGVGKSITSMAVLDYLTTNHKFLKFVEADTTNPDVWKSYGKVIESEGVDLDDVEGWIHLVNIADTHPFKAIVINTPARNNTGVRDHGAILIDALMELGRPLITLWVINRQRDSVDLLKEYLELMPGGTTHVVRNGYFGEERKFELYDKSPVHEAVLLQNGKDLFLPDLADRVTDELYSRRITLAEAAQQLKLGDRTELQRWRASVGEMFTSIGL
jgi:hypothetical protein